MDVPDIPRIYTAIAEWAACMVYVLILRKRFKGVKFIGLAALFLAVFAAVQLVAGELPLVLWIPGMAVAMLTIYFCIFGLSRIKALDAVFWAARAFVLAEFAASLEWQFYYYLTQNFSAAESPAVEYAFLGAVYLLVFTAAFFLEKRYVPHSVTPEFSGKDLISAAGTALAIFLISNISFITPNTPLSGQYAGEIFYIRTLVDFCGIILLYMQQESRLCMYAKLEVNAMHNILCRHYEQYRLSKGNLELINMRYHDLKHQISVIKTEANPEKKAAYIEEIERNLKQHEAQYDTGNKVLDTILYGKSMHCMKEEINFTCVADGKLLGFMDVMDLCSIVGNALDNAIESVSKLPEPEKRLIKMAVYAQNDLLMLRFENYIETSLNFENGLPVSTKSNKKNHGYGLKSIKVAAEKYGGGVKIVTTDNWFSLYLLIPRTKNGSETAASECELAEAAS